MIAPEREAPPGRSPDGTVTGESNSASLSKNDSIESLKGRIDVYQAGAILYRDWKAGRSCRSPFREDRSPSFSVFDNGRRWKDHATGDSGDVIDFWRVARGCALAEALQEIRGLFDGRSAVVLPAAAPVCEQRNDHAPHIPHLRRPTKGELRQLSGLRSIAVEALTIAVERGFLWSAKLRDHGESYVDAWIITDQERKVFSARRYDGGAWIRTGAKVYTLPGGRTGWPIGIRESGPFGAIALTEGGPDFLAAIAHAWASGLENQIAPVCMLSAQSRIPEDLIPCFSSKAVRIFIHDDDAGWNASREWAQQLKGIASSVDGFTFDGSAQSSGEPVKDLNDLLRIDCDDWERNRQTIESIMQFGEGGN